MQQPLLTSSLSLLGLPYLGLHYVWAVVLEVLHCGRQVDLLGARLDATQSHVDEEVGPSPPHTATGGRGRGEGKPWG